MIDIIICIACQTTPVMLIASSVSSVEFLINYFILSLPSPPPSSLSTACRTTDCWLPHLSQQFPITQNTRLRWIRSASGINPNSSTDFSSCLFCSTLYGVLWSPCNLREREIIRLKSKQTYLSVAGYTHHKTDAKNLKCNRLSCCRPPDIYLIF